MLSKERYVLIAVITIAFVVALTLAQGFNWLWVWAGWSNPALFGIGQLPLTDVLAFGLALGGGVGVVKHEPTYQLCGEVVVELSKVTWPTREETGSATVVVIVTVIICAAFLGAFDAVWLWLTDWILGIDGAGTG